MARENARYRARIAETSADLEAAQRLRYRAFFDGAQGRDADAFDPKCRHMLIEEVASGDLVATFRLMTLGSGADIARTYSAQFYGLEALADFQGRIVEMGRFCVDPGCRDPDILRTAWGALTAVVDAEGIELLIGCASFHGTDRKHYADAFAMLRDRHLAPKRWWPRVKAPDVFRFARSLRRTPDHARALKTMPPLLRSYLTLGGWVSDHAVVDRDMNTLHVFTGLEIRAIPPGRAKVLRALAEMRTQRTDVIPT